MNIKREEVEFAMQLFKLLNQLIDIILERYGEDFLDLEDQLHYDDYFEDDFLF